MTSGIQASDFSRGVYVENDKLVAGGWKNTLQRWFVPYFASRQDAKVTNYFIRYFADFFAKGEPLEEVEEAKTMLKLTGQHLLRAQNSRLEHYTLVAQKKLNCFELGSSLEQKCRQDNQGLLKKWTQLGFHEEAFWGSPDLVDFVFNSHLHRHITHPCYKHTIQMIGNEPHLLMNGRQTPWSEIRKTIHMDEDERLYSLENGQKRYWMYLDEGFTKWDKFNFDKLHRLHKLEKPPLRSRVEVITTHAHKENWNVLDRVLKGSRHSFFRIVPGEGFAARHSDAGLEDGSVYSIGWSAKWSDFSMYQPLSTLKGMWCSPDNFEFYKEDQCVTPVDVTDEQMLRLFEIMKKKSKENCPFHPITSNCCGGTVDVLNEAGIATFQTKKHLTNLLYKFLIPKVIRRPLNRIDAFFKQLTPTCLSNAITRINAIASSLFFMPLFTLLGAWRKKFIAVQPHFATLFDVFNPEKMEFDLTKKVYKQQKSMKQTYFEKHN